MNHLNPYESPQVTELGSSSATFKRNDQPNYGNEQFLRETLGPNWKKVCEGAQSCYIALTLLIAGMLFAVFLPEPLFILVVLAWLLYLVGLLNFLAVESQYQVKIYFVVALTAFCITSPLAFYLMVVSNHLVWIMMLSSGLISWFAFLIGVRKIGKLLANEKIVSWVSVDLAISIFPIVNVIYTKYGGTVPTPLRNYFTPLLLIMSVLVALGIIIYPLRIIRKYKVS